MMWYLACLACAVAGFSMGWLLRRPRPEVKPTPDQPRYRDEFAMAFESRIPRVYTGRGETAMPDEHPNAVPGDWR